MDIKEGEEVNRAKVDKIDADNIGMISTVSSTKRINQNRTKKWGNVRYRNSRPDTNDKVLDVAEQTEASKKVLRLVAEYGYSLTQVNGQRIFGPPCDWTGPAPGPGCEIFVGKIPRTLYEHDIFPVFNYIGKIYEIRLMMDFSGMNRGYCFIMYTKQEDAFRAVKDLDHYEIRPGRRIGVVASINYCRLYINQLPLDVTAETIVKRIYEITGNVEKVSVYRNANNSSHYALISYKTHRGAAMARRRLVPETATLFPGGKVNVEWAHPNFYPSNVLEECGTYDETGNIIMTKTFLPSTEPKKAIVRRLSRKNGKENFNSANENVSSESKQLHKTLQPSAQIIRCKSLPTNSDQSTASSITLTHEQPNHRDQQSKMFEEKNQYDHKMTTQLQDPNCQNNVVENMDSKREVENTAPKLYDVRSYKNDDTNSNPSNNSSSNPNGSDNNLLGSNINPLAPPFQQQNDRFLQLPTATNVCHVNETPISNGLTTNNQINLNHPTQREISLKLQAQALFQPSNEPWQNCPPPPPPPAPQLNPSYQSNGSLPPNYTLPNGNPSQNIPFHYNTYKSQVSSTNPCTSYCQDMNNIQDYNQYRLLVSDGLQKIWDIIAKIPSNNLYRTLLGFQHINQRNAKCLAGLNNHASPDMSHPCYYQAPCHFVPGHPSTAQEVLRNPKLLVGACSQEKPRTPRPILNRTRINGGEN